MARERDTKTNPLPPHESDGLAPVPDLQGMVHPEPQLNRPIPPGPGENPLHEVLMPAFLLMVFGACFIINPMAAAAAAQDEAVLAFFVFWFGAVSLLCRRFLLHKFPAVANAPVYLVRFVQNCVFGLAPDP